MLPWRQGRVRPTFVIGLALLLLAPFVAGCKAGRGTVSGHVLHGNKPVRGGWLTFRPADARENSVTVLISPQGEYEATLPVGDVQIGVDNREWQPVQSGGPQPTLPAGIKLPPTAKGSGGQTSPRKGGSAPKHPGTYDPIPPKYYSADTSGLRYTVKSGSQTHDIKLD